MEVSVTNLREVGEALGLAGTDLHKWIQEQQAEMRDERIRLREIAEKENERQENQRLREYEDKELQRKYDERQKQMELDEKEKQRQHEVAEKEREREELEKQRQHELELLRLNQASQSNVTLAAQQAGSTDSISNRNVKFKMPPFDEAVDEFDAYLLRFERLAVNQELPENKWAAELSQCLRGQALDVYSRLSPEESKDYASLKAALITRYGLTEEGYRELFKHSRPQKAETCKQFSTRLACYMDRWWEKAGIEISVKGIRDLLLRDQIAESCTSELSTFVMEHKCKSVGMMTDLADTFVRAHGGKGLITQNDTHAVEPTLEKRQPQKQTATEKTWYAAPEYGRSSANKPGCYNCGSQQHIAKYCSKPKSKSSMFGQAMMIVHKEPDQFEDHIKLPNGKSLPVLSAACEVQLIDNSRNMPVKRGYLNDKEVSVLRDSGCSGVVVKRGLIDDNQLTGIDQFCVMIDGTTRNAPEAEIYIETPYYTGNVTAICFESPVYDVIVGNIPGVKGVNDVNPRWRRNDKSGVSRGDDLLAAIYIQQEQKKKISNKLPTLHEDDNYKSDSIVSGVVADVINSIMTPYDNSTTPASHVEQRSGEVVESASNSVYRSQDIDSACLHLDKETSCGGLGLAIETRANTRQQRTLRPLVIPSEIGDVHPEEFKEAQANDESLNRTRAKIGSQGKHPIVIKRGLLYRNYTGKTNCVTPQLIVPQPYRSSVLKIAHDALMSGHLGTRKTADKIKTQFHWPGIDEDVSRYVRSCDVCQRTFPKGKNVKVPLGQMPIIDTPFERIAVDLIGPMDPMTDRKHRYVLTIVDYATRYPEAVALPNITTETVAEALVDVFCRVGIPSEILSDRGSQFTSDLMREVSRLLSIRQLTTTPYHPACNGLVERFNGTLKQMIRRMCEERPKDWDRYLGPALFAYRESPQESLGFSPFELLQGRTVKGPMAVLKTLWTGQITDPDVKTTYEYVLDLRNRLEKTCEMAKEELKKSSARYKKYYDTKSKERQMNVGDKVLVLLPTQANKLLMKWRGPYEIVEKVGLCDYKVRINNTTKIYHANMLKVYNERVAAYADISTVTHTQCLAVLVPEQEMELGTEFLPLESSQTIDDVSICENLTDIQREDVISVLQDYEKILTDLPGKTNLIEYDIKLTTDEPIRQKPYQIPQAVKQNIENEIESMLKLGVIERSTSSYNSPVVLVRKPDGSNRFCVDYRKLNRVTVFDAEPMPSTKELFSRLTHDRYFTKLDLTKGYWQVPLSENTKDKTSFSCSSGSYRFLTLPFGLVCAPAVFTKMMRKLLAGIKNVDNYIDDILIHTETWEEHVTILREVLDRMKTANLTIKPTKCNVGYNTIDFLGHQIGDGHILPLTTTLDKIQKSDRPKTKTQVRSFLGLTGYYREYIPNYAAVAVPLTDLTRKNTPNKVVWGDAQEKSFQHLKNLLSVTPILRLPDFNRRFVIRSDASDVGIGAVLLQEYDGELFPVSYASRKLLPRERNYSVIERECLAVVWAIDKFNMFVYGTEFLLQTDHKPLAYLNQSKLTNARVLRWALALQDYKFVIQDIRGVENNAADYLSRLDI